MTGNQLAAKIVTRLTGETIPRSELRNYIRSDTKTGHLRTRHTNTRSNVSLKFITFKLFYLLPVLFKRR